MNDIQLLRNSSPLSHKRLLKNLFKALAAGLLATLIFAAILPGDITEEMVRVHLALLLLGMLSGLVYIALSQQQRTNLHEWGITS